jgi:hypothetical protein
MCDPSQDYVAARPKAKEFQDLSPTAENQIERFETIQNAKLHQK